MVNLNRKVWDENTNSKISLSKLNEVPDVVFISSLRGVLALKETDKITYKLIMKKIFDQKFDIKSENENLFNKLVNIGMCSNVGQVKSEFAKAVRKAFVKNGTGYTLKKEYRLLIVR